jgi:hypothetical protein
MGVLIMPKVFVILGDKNARKSSTIRALTGSYNFGPCQIGTPDGEISVFVQIRALQEAEIPPQDFVDGTKGYAYILVPLRISGCRGMPDGLQYIQTFLEAGWLVANIAVLGTDNLPYHLPAGLPVPLFIPNSAVVAANGTANTIRGAWNWL